MVYTSILKRLLGVLYLNKKDKTGGMTATEFFNRYPSIYVYIQKKLLEQQKTRQFNYPLLLLLSRFQPPVELYQEEIMNSLIPLLSCGLDDVSISIREASSLSIISLFSMKDLPMYLRCCCDTVLELLKMNSYSMNSFHSLLMQVYQRYQVVYQ